MEQNPRAEQEERNEPNTQEIDTRPSVGALAPAGSAAGNLGRGHEEPSDIEDLEIPRVKLVQFTSEEAQTENRDERIEAGTIINSITKEELGNIFVPVYKFTNFIQWNPRKKDDPNFDPAFDPGAMIFSSNNRRDPRVVDGIKFGPNGEAPKVTKYINFLCYFPVFLYPLILGFSKTSYAAGKKLNTLTQVAGGDMFANKYKLSVNQKENAGTKFFTFDVSPSGKTSPEEFGIAEMWYNEFRGKLLKIHSQEAPKMDSEDGWPE